MATTTGPRSRISFDEGWTYHLGDDLAKPRRVVAKGGTANGWSDFSEDETEKFRVARTGIEKMGNSFQSIQLRPRDQDATWTRISLPHDWRIEQSPSPDHDFPKDYPKGWQGLWPIGVAYYRKTFELPAHSPQQHIQLTFDGIGGFSDIWLNGFWIGQQTTSYTPLALEVTELIRSDLPNVLLVRTDSTESEGWWLEGGGIYRHVWLETYNDIHIKQDGIFVATPEVSSEEAKVTIELEIRNDQLDTVDTEVVLGLQSPSGADVSLREEQQSIHLSVPGMTTSTIRQEIVIRNPELWQLGQGRLYTLVVSILRLHTSEVSDHQTSKFGVRQFEWQKDGFTINGIKSKVFGVNLHQDFGFYGSALPDRISEAKLDMCAEMGVNAIRCAHHAPTPELVAHADRIGMLILPEQRVMSSSTVAIEQLRGMIRRLRGHPSVFMWSLENEEIGLQGTAIGSAILRRLIQECKYLDSNRLTTTGGVAELEDKNFGYYSQLDVVGMHYRCLFGNLEESLALHPDKIHVLDEEGLFAATRGVYHYDKGNAYSGSFSYIHEALRDRDEPSANGAIGDIDPRKFCPVIERNMTLAFSHPQLAGAFVWTGIDYYGEPSPGRWPAVANACGQRDLGGLTKDYYWLMRSIFKETEPLVHGFPHWTWPGKEGENVVFGVYSNCDEVEVEANGATVGGRLPVTHHKAQLPDGLVYQPGTVTVRGFRGGVAVAEQVQHTAGAPSSLKLTTDRTTLSSSGKDVAIVRVAVVDAEGHFVPNAQDVVKFSAEGPGRVAGLCNGNTTFSKYLRSTEETALFHGQAVAYIEAATDEGDIRVTAMAPGLNLGTTTIQVSKEVDQHGPHNALDERKVSVYGTYTQLSS
ncbi:hypothetical protein ACHAP3_008850 [Botrytis cinerea]